MSGLTTNTTIKFVSAAAGDGDIQIEMNDEKNLGKSEFSYGDTVYFKVYTNPSAMALSFITTAGSIITDTNGSEEQEEELQFIDETTATLKLLPQAGGSITSSWYGAAPYPGASVIPVTGSGGNATGTVKLSPEPPEGTDHYAGICKATYTAGYRGYSLSGVTSTVANDAPEFPVLVFVIGS